MSPVVDSLVEKVRRERLLRSRPSIKGGRIPKDTEAVVRRCGSCGNAAIHLQEIPSKSEFATLSAYREGHIKRLVTHVEQCTSCGADESRVKISLYCQFRRKSRIDAQFLTIDGKVESLTVVDPDGHFWPVDTADTETSIDTLVDRTPKPEPCEAVRLGTIHGVGGRAERKRKDVAHVQRVLVDFEEKRLEDPMICGPSQLPADVLNAALQFAELDEDEVPLVVVSTNRTTPGADGLLLTSRRIHSSELGTAIEYDDMSGIEIRKGLLGSALYIGGEKVATTKTLIEDNADLLELNLRKLTAEGRARLSRVERPAEPRKAAPGAESKVDQSAPKPSPKLRARVREGTLPTARIEEELKALTERKVPGDLLHVFDVPGPEVAAARRAFARFSPDEKVLALARANPGADSPRVLLTESGLFSNMIHAPRGIPYGGLEDMRVGSDDEGELFETNGVPVLKRGLMPDWVLPKLVEVLTRLHGVATGGKADTSSSTATATSTATPTRAAPAPATSSPGVPTLDSSRLNKRMRRMRTSPSSVDLPAPAPMHPADAEPPAPAQPAPSSGSTAPVAPVAEAGESGLQARTAIGRRRPSRASRVSPSETALRMPTPSRPEPAAPAPTREVPSRVDRPAGPAGRRPLRRPSSSSGRKPILPDARPPEIRAPDPRGPGAGSPDRRTADRRTASMPRVGLSPGLRGGPLGKSVPMAGPAAGPGRPGLPKAGPPRPAPPGSAPPKTMRRKGLTGGGPPGARPSAPRLPGPPARPSRPGARPSGTDLGPPVRRGGLLGASRGAATRPGPPSGAGRPRVRAGQTSRSLARPSRPEGLNLGQIEFQRELAGEANKLWQAGRFEQALDFVERCEAANPLSAELAYGHGALLASLGDVGMALDSLMRACRFGFADSRRLQSDPSWRAARGDPDFQRLLQRVASRAKTDESHCLEQLRHGVNYLVGQMRDERPAEVRITRCPACNDVCLDPAPLDYEFLWSRLEGFHLEVIAPMTMEQLPCDACGGYSVEIIGTSHVFRVGRRDELYIAWWLDGGQARTRFVYRSDGGPSLQEARTWFDAGGRGAGDLSAENDSLSVRLGSRLPEVVESAVRDLGVPGNVAALGALGSLLETLGSDLDPTGRCQDPWLMRECLESIVEIGAPEGLDPIFTALNRVFTHSYLDEAVARAMVEAAAELGGGEVLGDVLGLVQGEARSAPPELVGAFAAALVDVGDALRAGAIAREARTLLSQLGFA